MLKQLMIMIIINLRETHLPKLAGNFWIANVLFCKGERGHNFYTEN